MELGLAMAISAKGMKAQGTRMRVISENIANADSLSPYEGGEPYRRKIVTFQNVLDRKLGAELVSVKGIELDKTPFKKSYNPGHPAANEDGYVISPNVNPLIEMMDMREAQRSYEANLRIIGVAKSMLTRTIDMLR